MRIPAIIRFVLTAALALLVLTGCGDDKRPPNEVNAPEDIEGRRIGAIVGTPSASLAQAHGEVVVYNSESELADGLTDGETDCAVMDRAAAEELTAAHSGIRVLGEALLEYNLCFAVPRENAQLLEAVNEALETLDGAGVLEGLSGKYLSGQTYEYKPPERAAESRGEMTLAVSGDYPPYAYRGADGELTGLDAEVARAVCAYLEVDIEPITEVGAGELVMSVWTGAADLAVGWLPDDAPERVSVSEPYAEVALVVVVRG